MLDICMQDSDSLGRNGKIRRNFGKLFFLFERMGLMVGRGEKKARLIIVKGRLIVFKILIIIYLF